MHEIDPIPRGADLTDDDLRLFVDDFYAVRNWAALRMKMGVPEMKEHLFQAMRARLGRRPLFDGVDWREREAGGDG